jgi:hypothetical protein
MNQKELTELLDRLDSLSHDERVDFAGRIQERYEELDKEDASLSDTQEMVKLGHAASRVAPFLAGGKVAALGELVASSDGRAGAVQRMARAAGKPKPSPEAAPTRISASLVATGEMGGINAGTPITDKYELAQGMADTLAHMPKDGLPRGAVVVARSEWSYPEGRKLGQGAIEDLRTIDAVTSPAALVATGGICAPVNVDYNISTWASAERPVKDGLPAFETPRGGIRFVQPPDIAEWEGATGIWTEATDAEPAGATKPVKVMVCGSQEEVLESAVATRIGFGNMQSRFAPEQVAANTDMAMAAAARVAERNLLEQIEAVCVKNVKTETLLGATRDILTMIGQAVAGYRNLHRIPRKQMMTMILPDWCKEMVRVDLAREIGHAQNDYFNALAVTDELIEDMLHNAGINPIWHLDGQPEPSSKNYKTQFWAAPEEGKVIKAFPTEMVSYLFVEGSIQFMDGGRLDLGVVRDATLDATNDYEVMVETFENIANRGFAHSAWQLVSTLCANGASAGTISTSGKCA